MKASVYGEINALISYFVLRLHFLMHGTPGSNHNVLSPLWGLLFFIANLGGWPFGCLSTHKQLCFSYFKNGSFFWASETLILGWHTSLYFRLFLWNLGRIFCEIGREFKKGTILYFIRLGVLFLLFCHFFWRHFLHLLRIWTFFPQQISLIFLQLHFKTQIGTHSTPFGPDKANRTFKAQLILPHDIGNYNGCRLN